MSQKLFEDYVKAIYQICSDSNSARANTGVIARRIGVGDNTASSMIRTLADAGLVSFTSYGGATLTEPGHLLAQRVLRRHRLVTLLFTTVLDMDSSEVCAEAELLEHAISENLADRIEAFLEQPVSADSALSAQTRDS